MQNLPKNPVVCLKGVSQLPNALLILLQAVHGPEEIEGKHTYLKSPVYIQAVYPLGAAAPSQDMEDYFGGHTKVYGDTYYFWVPPNNTVVAMAANTPPAVQKAIYTHSPLTIPIYCFATPKDQGRTVLEVDGTVFNEIDPNMVTDLEEYRHSIFLLLDEFSRWLRSKPKHWNQCMSGVWDFYPQARNGRFVSTVVSDEGTILAISLALFKGLLNFAVKKEWITLERANEVLNEAWQQVMPESFPKAAADTTNTGPLNGSWDTPNVFWSFLSKYLQENQKAVSLSGAPCGRDTVAVAHELPDGKYLIFPREPVAHAYIDYLEQRGVQAPSEERKKWETTLQRTILGWGLQVKTEGKDISWRFKFYKEDGSSDKCKINCLAIPLVQFPDFILDKLSEWFGEEFECWLPPQAARSMTEEENVPKGEENE